MECLTDAMEDRQNNKRLINLAREVANNAYAPYSQFKVGCVVVTERGNLYTGCNVENVSYGLTICAERTAVFKAVSEEGPDMKIKKILIFTATEKPATPCGACRQVLSEFGNDFEVISACTAGEEFVKHIGELLPANFDLKKELDK